VGDADERVPPQAEGNEDAQRRPRHLEREVGHRPPGHPVPDGGLQPSQEAGSAGKGLWVRDRLAEHAARHPTHESTDAARTAQREAEDGEAEERDGQDEPRHHGEPDEREADPGEAAGDEEEGQLHPDALREGLAHDAPGEGLDLGGLLLADGERHLATHQAYSDLAVLGALCRLFGGPFGRPFCRHASLRSKSTAPSQMATTV
jgi:hypothetical protein